MSHIRSHQGRNGRDVPTGSPSTNNKILLSTVGSDGEVHYAAIAMPVSYADAHRKATVTFHAHLGNAVATPQKIVLKYGMRSALGYVVWATIDQNSWVDVVENGGEVRVEVTGAVAATRLSQAQWNESFLPGTLLTFRFQNGGGGSATLATTLVPKTYEDAKKAAIELFKFSQRDAQQLSLELWIPDATGLHCFNPRIIHPSQWQPVILRTAKDNPRFQVSVKVPGHWSNYND